MSGWEWVLLVFDNSEVLEWMDGSGFSLCLTRVKS